MVPHIAKGLINKGNLILASGSKTVTNSESSMPYYTAGGNSLVRAQTTTPKIYKHSISYAIFFDTYPVNSHTVIISSTKIGGIGQYDLYLAAVVTGKKWSLNLYNPYINSNNNELGACYSPL